MDLARCLLASSTNFAWKFARYYVSEIKSRFELRGVLDETNAAFSVTNTDLACITGTKQSLTQLLQRKKVMSRQDRLFEDAYANLCTLEFRREACLARALEAGICSAFYMHAEKVSTHKLYVYLVSRCLHNLLREPAAVKSLQALAALLR